ncbi:Hypothetical protein AJAP_28025 [Amycolatopsis japonica]|uniref:Uncharacterized protein n=1 Tax=Amycolatopsis japonica TaxID=208439 RepID=A0A075V1H1_9PSEU|nr:Hypothetical protein AJAP_28025 [Amycolatopsis japonica]
MTHSLERLESGTVLVFHDEERIGHYWPDPLSGGFAAFKSSAQSHRPIARPKSERACILSITDGAWDGEGWI